MCLIGNNGEQLVANHEALRILSAITQPMVVVAIVGLYRTGKSYLMNKLAGKEKGSDERTEKFNVPRLCIQKFFPVKKCFIFDSPADRNKLSKLQTLNSDELSTEFVQELSEFCSHVFTHSKTKTLPGGIQVNGPRLESLVVTYVDAINSGALPCMENAVITLARRENSAAMQKAVTHYDQQMSQKVQLPTETLQQLLELHRTCENEAMEIFRKHSFKDEDQCFQKELKRKEARASAARAEAQRLKAIRIQEEQRRAEQERQHQEELRQIEISKANFRAEQERIRNQRMQQEAARIKAEQEAKLRELNQQLEAARAMSRHSSGGDCILL
ncbi:hypothetical protein NN561_001590 [Cricetulus griseus]